MKKTKNNKAFTIGELIIVILCVIFALVGIVLGIIAICAHLFH